MAASKSLHVRLLHMQEELDWMVAPLSGLSYEAFAASVVNIRAAERGLLIISEAAKSLPDEMLTPYPQIEWHAVRSIGNVLRHEYDQVSPYRLWITVTTYLPDLRQVVDDMVKRRESPA